MSHLYQRGSMEDEQFARRTQGLKKAKPLSNVLTRTPNYH